jgi:hypothetical protein
MHKAQAEVVEVQVVLVVMVLAPMVALCKVA